MLKLTDKATGCKGNSDTVKNPNNSKTKSNYFSAILWFEL